MKHILLFLFCLISIHVFAQTKTEPTKIELDTIYNIVDVLPTYIGGEDGWKKYLKKNLKYPRKAWWEELETDVVVGFVIRKDGSVTNVMHLTAFGWGFEEEAVRLVANSGKWNPGLKNGKAVHYHAKITIPFRLRISKGEKE